MKIVRVAAGCAAIASGISFFAGHPMKGTLFAACALVLMAGWFWQDRKTGSKSNE